MNQAAAPASSAGQIGYIYLKCRAMNLLDVAPDANTKFTFAFEQTLQTNDLFEATNTKLDKIGNPTAEDVDYSFEVTLQLKRPISAY